MPQELKLKVKTASQVVARGSRWLMSKMSRETLANLGFAGLRVGTMGD